MKGMTFNFRQLSKFDDAFFEFLELRKRFFVDQLAWDIPHDQYLEMDQYDNPKACYSLVEMDGHIVGGARTMPTTAKWGAHTCMLSDAIDGKLIDIPRSVMDENLSDPTTWECTRLVISDDLETQVERSQCLHLIVTGLVDMAAQNGAVQLVSLSPVALTRALRQLGFAARRIGSPYVNEGDGRRYAVLAMPAEHSHRAVEPIVPVHEQPVSEPQLALN